MNELNPHVLRSLACCQLSWMIRRGRFVDECKAEWARRWRLPYPKYRTATGVAEEAM